jgi:hypothetical protein
MTSVSQSVSFGAGGATGAMSCRSETNARGWRSSCSRLAGCTRRRVGVMRIV